MRFSLVGLGFRFAALSLVSLVALGGVDVGNVYRCSSAAAQDESTPSQGEQEVEDEQVPSEQEIQQELSRILQNSEDNLPEAVKYLNKQLKHFPVKHEIYLMAASLNMSLGDSLVANEEIEAAAQSYLEATAIAEKVAADPEHIKEADSFLGIIFYHGGKAYALKDMPKEMYASLEKAFEFDFAQVEEIQEEIGYKKYADSEEFKAFITKQKELIAVRIQQKLVNEFNEFESFPFDFQLTTVNDEEISKEKYKGKVLIVDVWGTWCPPCREEVPHFVALQKEYGDKGLQIVGCNSENEETPEENVAIVKKSIEEFNINYPCALIDDQFYQQIPEFQGFPTTLFIDSTGKVRMMMVGAQPKVRLEAAVKFLMEEPKTTQE